MAKQKSGKGRISLERGAGRTKRDKAQETALPNTTANPNDEHNVLHTPGGEMPDADKKAS